MSGERKMFDEVPNSSSSILCEARTYQHGYEEDFDVKGK